jgi:hypothetical protein
LPSNTRASPGMCCCICHPPHRRINYRRSSTFMACGPPTGNPYAARNRYAGRPGRRACGLSRSDRPQMELCNGDKRPAENRGRRRRRYRIYQEADCAFDRQQQGRPIADLCFRRFQGRAHDLYSHVPARRSDRGRRSPDHGNVEHADCRMQSGAAGAAVCRGGGGTNDLWQPYDGFLGTESRLLSVPETVEFWRVRHGCTGQQMKRLPHRLSEDTTGSCCPSGQDAQSRARYNSIASTAAAIRCRAGNPDWIKQGGPLNHDIETAEEFWSFARKFNN